ncbi:Uncharacterised protein [Klebsiella pneumoniae]|nr:Uncharacterised protein [Klebsiella pneumoniae]SVR66992.1 Uncharacterised protein [Klebsiella pneumoniae]SVV56574.1 Uncharacterised protein [Klebsiella pneumoniae]SWG77421.1 Uncharacterised protein [Klebsiella pneumoniae]
MRLSRATCTMAEVPLPTPTQVPVPSTDIRNAVFAGAKLDEEVTGTGEFYTDRLGVKRLTNTGRNNQFDAAQLDRANRFEQFLLSSGYVFLGDYEDGPFQFSARNQYIRYDNQYYRLNAATDVGFTTTGTDATSFANDVTHFVLMDGDTLRQNLGSDEGADLVAGKKPYTGTMRRKVAEMLSETISPWDFGCKPDAVFDPVTQRLIDGTDNTANLQRMFSEAHYHGVEINLPFSGKFASKSLYLHYDPVKNPDWTDRPGRLTIRGSVLGHATGDVERQGTAIYHIPGENSPLISMIGEFSISNPAAMGGYFELSSLNLIGSQDSSDVLLLQGSQGQMKLERYDVKVLNPAGNGITESTTWETLHLLGFIRGPATGDGSCTGIGLNIKSDGTIGQINMKQYLLVNVMKMGYGIRAGRREKTNGTLGPLVFTGGQTSGADHHGMWLDGGVISFTSIGQQHEGCRKNGIRIDNILEDGVVSSDLARTIKFQQNYITGCGRIEDGSQDSYGVNIVNGDGIELDTITFNEVGNGIAFDAANVDNLLIRRPHFRTVRAYGTSQGFGIRSFSDGVPQKRQYLEHPVFNQTPATQIDDKAREIFGRGAAGGRISFSTNTPTPSIIHGSGSGNESYHILNFNNPAATTITNITGGTPYQRLLVTFSNDATTIQHSSNIVLRGGKDVQGTVGKTLELYYTGSFWQEVGDPVRALTGTSANRPFSTAFPGMEYFDTTLNKPIWRNAANNGWVDAAGNVV